MKIIFATNNQDKLREVREILSGFDFRVDMTSLKDEGIQIDVEETGSTFEENAAIKARAIMEITGAIVMADDSGLEVDYLDKAPGVYSARYMGETTDYSIKNKNIIERLSGAVGDQRSARFVCAIATAFPDGRIVTTRGTVEGLIAYEEKGSNGFGYDPIVFIPEFAQTLGEMPSELKNKISHRYNALCRMGEILGAIENEGKKL
ncbi:RdgB/HAM1 family non-canonical purine NTP pyrophosphatase [Parasporobacterium paucivorans]|uniref:dITP/XTP pyrophosphatase n=1 Tax=Parasporobacterium paucivorans DSM 15970 TaxID=1122934 RepID=A0A1M6J1W1_9FIRM|nr:RdgB/HAM1 family non-canonical purine NTP pyrophosphatase [Parasporobacterium paucivorans]SHJ40656.1 XTP/dITP diphosphohydrolase [Parasporobacterium paucivorans DSM 15970]